MTFHPMSDIEDRHKIKFGGIIPKDVDDPFPTVDGKLDLNDYMLVPRDRYKKLIELLKEVAEYYRNGKMGNVWLEIEAAIKDEEV
jgi:hypothetical protein